MKNVLGLRFCKFINLCNRFIVLTMKIFTIIFFTILFSHTKKLKQNIYTHNIQYIRLIRETRAGRTIPVSTRYGRYAHRRDRYRCQCGWSTREVGPISGERKDSTCGARSGI